MLLAVCPRGPLVAAVRPFLIVCRRAAPVRYASRSNGSSTGQPDHPVVDVGGLLPKVTGSVGSGQRRAGAIMQLRAALLGGPGYFYAANVDVLPADYIQEVYGYARRLHELPHSIKNQFAGQGGSAQVGATYSGADVGEPELAYNPKDIATVRSWDYSRLPWGSNQARYPKVTPDFKTTLDELYHRQNSVASALLEAFAEILELPHNTFTKHFEAGDLGTIRLLHYPGGDEPGVADANIGIAPHTDFEVFTLMHQNAPGLQFLPASATTGRTSDSDGALLWIDAPVRKAEFVVILGDVLERFTNGVLRATPHRVLRTNAPRMSIIRFNAVAPDTVIEPLDVFVTPERPRAYTRCTMQQHMRTTIHNLEMGLGSWDADKGISRSANYRYEE